MTKDRGAANGRGEAEALAISAPDVPRRRSPMGSAGSSPSPASGRPTCAGRPPTRPSSPASSISCSTMKACSSPSPGKPGSLPAAIGEVRRLRCPTRGMPKRDHHSARPRRLHRPAARQDRQCRHLPRDDEPARAAPGPRGRISSVRPSRRRTSPGIASLYRRIGERWLWFSRAVMADETTACAACRRRQPRSTPSSATDEAIGFAELEPRHSRRSRDRHVRRRARGDRHRRGPLSHGGALDRAWTPDLRRVWLHTCTFDHPAAIRSTWRAASRRGSMRSKSRTIPALGLPAAGARRRMCR